MRKNYAKNKNLKKIKMFVSQTHVHKYVTAIKCVSLHGDCFFEGILFFFLRIPGSFDQCSIVKYTKQATQKESRSTYYN